MQAAAQSVFDCGDLRTEILNICGATKTKEIDAAIIIFRNLVKHTIYLRMKRYMIQLQEDFEEDDYYWDFDQIDLQYFSNDYEDDYYTDVATYYGSSKNLIIDCDWFFNDNRNLFINYKDMFDENDLSEFDDNGLTLNELMNDAHKIWNERFGLGMPPLVGGHV